MTKCLAQKEQNLALVELLALTCARILHGVVTPLSLLLLIMPQLVAPSCPVLNACSTRKPYAGQTLWPVTRSTPSAMPLAA